MSKIPAVSRCLFLGARVVDPGDNKFEVNHFSHKVPEDVALGISAIIGIVFE